MLRAYLPASMQEVLPNIQDFLLQIQIKNYLTLANTLKALGALSASYVAFKVAKILAARRRYAHLPGPRTKGILQFFVGNVPPPAKMQKEGKSFPDYLLEWHQKYGAVFKFQILDQIVVATIDPNLIKEVLVVKNFPKSTLFFKPLMWPYNVRLLGNGLVTTPDNKAWREQRSIFNPGFHRNALMNYVDEFNSKADILMEKLRSMADGKTTINLADELGRTTLDAIASIAFGMNLDSINNEKDRIFCDYLAETLTMIGELFSKPWLKFPPFSWSRARRLRKIVGFYRETGREQILKRSKENPDSAGQNDILARILKGSGIVSESDLIDLEIMVDNFITFLGGGQDTTANTLSFCFLEMGRNQQVYEKCREEVDNVLGSRNEITYEDISKLKYVGCVFKEALRIYPAGPFLSRYLTDDVESANGLRIPANTHIAFSPYVSGRLETNFPNPLEFKPERFIKDANSMDTTVPSYAYFPFSIGPRNCIGQNFAQIESIIILAKFVQKFDFRLDTNQSFKIKFENTLKPKDGTNVILSIRS